jgi:hypothetical protein
MAFDPTEHNVDYIRTEIDDIDDPDQIAEMIETEEDNKDRTSALDAMRGRQSTLSEDEGGDDEGTPGAGEGRSSASSPTERA